MENHEALAVIDEKLSERILTKQIKLVKGLEQVSTAVEKASETLAASQEKLITSMVKMTEVITQMSQGMGKLIESSEALNKSHANTLQVIERADTVVISVVANLEHLGYAQEKLNKEYISRAALQCE